MSVLVAGAGALGTCFAALLAEAGAQVSVLVKRTDRTKLQNLLRRFSRDWKDKRKIEITGPWPPYSFVSRESESKS